MLKNIKHKKIYLTGIIVIGITIVSTGVGKAALGDPGSKDDPLVTLSYIEKRIEQIRFYVDEKVNEVLNISNSNKVEIAKLTQENIQLKAKVEGVSTGGTVQAGIYEVVEVQKGQKLIGKTGAEIILRAGKSKAIASDNGGLPDLTGGIDLKMNQNIPLNHLIIIPRDDGRGMLVEEYSYFMVKGAYEIE